MVKGSLEIKRILAKSPKDLNEDDLEALRAIPLILTPESERERFILQAWLKVTEHDRICTAVLEGKGEE